MIMKCTSNDKRILRSAAEFPEKLQETHGDKISICPDAVFEGVMKPIDVVCNVCGNQWQPIVNNLISCNKGCGKCSQEKTKRVGVVRFSRASQAMKELAKVCRQAGMTFDAIAELLKRNNKTVRMWCDPEQRARKNAYMSEYMQENAERSRATTNANDHRRRLIKYEQGYAYIPDHPDANGAGWVEYDMSDLFVDRDGFYLECNGATDEVMKLVEQRNRMTELTGVQYEIDHLIPLAAGGIHHPANLCIRTAESNYRKKSERYVKDDELFCKRLFNIN